MAQLEAILRKVRELCQHEVREHRRMRVKAWRSWFDEAWRDKPKLIFQYAENPPPSPANFMHRFS
eukprot:2727275-Karenia_brevis.AAC.1